MKGSVCHLNAYLAEHELLQLTKEPLPSNPLHIVRCIDVDGYVGQMLVYLSQCLHKLSVSVLSYLSCAKRAKPAR